MNKSFQTSGGTVRPTNPDPDPHPHPHPDPNPNPNPNQVLSTNWGEVGTKDYEEEKSAPDGQEWKKWG